MDQDELIKQLQADKDELSAKLEALQTEYDQSVARYQRIRLKILWLKIKDY